MTDIDLRALERRTLEAPDDEAAKVAYDRALVRAGLPNRHSLRADLVDLFRQAIFKTVHGECCQLVVGCKNTVAGRVTMELEQHLEYESLSNLSYGASPFTTREGLRFHSLGFGGGGSPVRYETREYFICNNCFQSLYHYLYPSPGNQIPPRFEGALLVTIDFDTFSTFPVARGRHTA